MHDENKIISLIQPDKKRQEMRNTQLFSLTNKPWNEGRFNQRNKIGCISLIWKNAHNYYFGNDTTKIMSMEQFQNYYFISAEYRDNNLSSHSCGRTLSELYDLALNFKNYLKYNYDINVDISTSMNFVYIRVIDEGYIGYSAEHKAIIELNSLNNELKNHLVFESTDEDTDIKYMIDVIAIYNNIPVAGISIKSLNYKYSKNPYMNKVRDMNNTRQMTFTNDTGLKTIYLYYNKEGKIENRNEIKEFLKNETKKYL